MDILIPLGTDSNWNNNELRYCLRSIERYAAGYDRIFVVGTNPGFLRLNHEFTRIDTNPENPKTIRANLCPFVVKFFPLADLLANKQARIAYKIAYAFNHTDISDEIAFWNDDFVLTATTDIRSLPYYYRCTLAESAEVLPDNNAYKRNLLATARRLKYLGHPTLDYDCHVPVRYTRQHFNALSALWMESAICQVGYVVKSTYCNHYVREPITPTHINIGFPKPTLITDCKIRSQSFPEIEALTAGRWIFSYSDSALFDTGNPIPETCGLKRWLGERFPNKSTFEK